MARIKYSYGLLDTHAKCTNKGLLGNGVSRGLRFGVGWTLFTYTVYYIIHPPLPRIFCTIQYNKVLGGNSGPESSNGRRDGFVRSRTQL